MTPAEEAIAYLAQFEDKDSILIAGHLPSLAEVASALLTSGSKATIQFERGGIGRIDVDKLPTNDRITSYNVCYTKLLRGSVFTVSAVVVENTAPQTLLRRTRYI